MLPVDIHEAVIKAYRRGAPCGSADLVGIKPQPEAIMSKIVAGQLLDKKVTQKVYKSLHKGNLTTINAIVVHQTGAATAQHTFNSYTSSSNGAHLLIDKNGRIYQTALTHRKTYHIGKIRSRCIETKSCSKTDLSIANSIYLKKGLSYPVRVKKVHDHEKVKPYPDRYPTNSDSIGIEIVGNYDKSKKSYESVNAKQNLSLKWLINELSTHLQLQGNDIYRHPEVSYKQPSEAKTASW